MASPRPAEPDTDEEAAPGRGPLGYLRALGPGLISGASDNDPTTVATMSVVGASTVYGLSWLVVLIYPMLAAIQMISAQVGVASRHGLQRCVRSRYGRSWGLVLLISVVAVNLVTIAADLEAGAASLALLFHVDLRWFVVPYGALLLSVLLFGSYDNVQRVLKYVLLVFGAYIVAAFLAHPDWSAVLRATVQPKLSLSTTYIQGALALLGTSLTSYAYVWETIEESEEHPPVSSLGLARADAGVGMFVAVAIFWFTLVATGATLGVRHEQVQTAEQAARALQPAAGSLASDLFAVGLLASSIIAVPVLAATTGYVLGQEFGWRRGLSKRVSRARLFYGTIVATVLLAVLASFTGIRPIQLLFVASIAGGLGTPISLAMLLLIARDRATMRGHPVGFVLTAIGWATFTLVTAISLYFLWQQLGGWL